MKTKKTKEENIEKEIEEVTNELLSLMGIGARAKVSLDETNDAYLVAISAQEEAGLLIGRRGETLASLQTIISLLVRQKKGEWVRVVVNVGDWREKEEEKLKSLAQGAAERAKETGQPQPLYNLSASQRRTIHLFLADDPAVETESAGEGEERYLLVKPNR